MRKKVLKIPVSLFHRSSFLLCRIFVNASADEVNSNDILTCISYIHNENLPIKIIYVIIQIIMFMCRLQKGDT